MAEMDYEEKPKEDGDKASKRDFVKFWLDAISAASKEDEDWLKHGEAAVQVYRGDQKADVVFANSREFNIFHSNIETTLPAIYNSTPAPDVRRRFRDKDPVAKTVSQIIERCLSFSVDNYDFDETMRQVLFDGMVPGRGVARVRYVPYFTEMPEPGEQPEAPEAPEGAANTAEQKPGEALAYEEVKCEYVPWKRFRVGPADEWNNVPWLAFEHFLTRSEIEKLAGKKVAEQVSLDCKINGEPGGDDNTGIQSDTFRRGRVWEIWDADEKRVLFIATGYPDDVLMEEADPLGLDGFYPVPRPVQPIMTPGNMVPVCPYSVYSTLVEELNEITGRIKKIVRQIRVRGGYAAGGQDLDRMLQADDGELVPLQGLEQWLQAGLDKAVIWWPIEPAVKALAQLYQQREQVKQTIYEITGISDIVRGASKASETATAQEIKNQWGSLRIQKLQQDVQRFARDLFRLKAEIIAKRFRPETIMMISGIRLLPKEQKALIQQQMQPPAPVPGQPPAPPPQLPPEVMQAMKEPALEDVQQVLQSDLMRSYRIDIESDSTIRADLTRNQKAMGEFLQGTAQYIGAVGPAVQGGQMPQQAAVEIYTAFARNYKLGKQAEDALETMSEAAQKPQPPKPDPEAEKAKAQIGLEREKMQIQQQGDQARLQLEMQKTQMQAQNDQAKAQSDMALAQQKMQFDMELEREKAGQQYQIEMMKANADIEIKREMAAQQAQLAREQSVNKMYLAEGEAATKAEIARKQSRQQARQ